MSAQVIPFGDGRAPTILTAHGARAKTDRARELLERGAELVVELYRGRAHEALGYGSGPAGWQAYVEAEFGGIKTLRIDIGHRRELVAAMHADGFGREAIRDSIGYGLGTVQRDLEAAGAIDLTAKRAARAARELDPFRGLSPRWEVLARVAAQEDRGLTSIELDAELDRPLGTATGALSKLAAARLEYLALGAFDEARRNRRPYRITEAGRVKLAEVLAQRDAAEAGDAPS